MSDRSQERRARRRRRQRRNRGIKRAIGVCAAGIILITGGVFLYNGVINRDGPTPDMVEGVTADVCYHDITLKWEPARKASGYYIYGGMAGDQELTRLGQVEGADACSFEMDDYTRDQEYVFQVRAYGENAMTKNRTEGDPSEEITAGYDSSRYAQKIPVLTYHDLVPKGYDIVNGLTVPEEVFEEQMQYLKDEGYRTLSLDELYQWYKGKLELPVKSCAVTFDDGAYEIYYLAYPILKRNDQYATEFCIGHHLDEVGENTAPYTPEDGIARRYGTDVLEEMRTDYPKFACESHTYNMHKRIDGYKPVNKLTYEEMLEDFQKNEKFGFHYLAYPWGASNKDMRKAAKVSGYKLAFGYGPCRYARRTDNQFNIRRIKVSAYYSMDTFIKMVDGTWEEESEKE